MLRKANPMRCGTALCPGFHPECQVSADQGFRREQITSDHYPEFYRAHSGLHSENELSSARESLTGTKCHHVPGHTVVFFLPLLTESQQCPGKADLNLQFVSIRLGFRDVN